MSRHRCRIVRLAHKRAVRVRERRLYRSRSFRVRKNPLPPGPQSPQCRLTRSTGPLPGHKIGNHRRPGVAVLRSSHRSSGWSPRRNRYRPDRSVARVARFGRIPEGQDIPPEVLRISAVAVASGNRRHHRPWCPAHRILPFRPGCSVLRRPRMSRGVRLSPESSTRPGRPM